LRSCSISRRDHDAIVHLALAQAHRDDLVTDILAELGERHTVVFESLPQLRGGQLVLFGDAIDGLVELGVVHAQPRFPWRTAAVPGP
jgi:hypothetical protein